MIDPSEYPKIPDPLGYDEIECRLCGKIYPHPRSSNAGYGRCGDCFFAEFDAGVRVAEDYFAQRPMMPTMLDSALEPHLFEDTQ